MDLSKLTLGSTPINLKAPLPTRATLANKPFSLDTNGRVIAAPEAKAMREKELTAKKKYTRSELAQYFREKAPQLFGQFDDETIIQELTKRRPELEEKIIEEPKKDGILKSLLKTPVRALATGISGLTGGPGTKENESADQFGYDMQGNFVGTMQQKDINVPGFGEVKPIGADIMRGNVGAGIRDIIGSGLELGSYAVGAGATKEAAKQGLGKVLQFGAKEGAAIGGLSGLGIGLQEEDASIGSVLKDTAIGAGFGAGVGTALPLASAGVTRAGRAIGDLSKNITEKIGGLFKRSDNQAIAKLEKVGFEKPQIDVLVGASKRDAEQMRKMTQYAEEVSLNPLSKNRPSNVVGENVIDRVKYLQEQRQKAGVGLNKTIEAMPDSPLDVTDIRLGFEDDLAEMGVRVRNDGTLDFRNSRLSGKNMQTARKLMQETYNDIRANADGLTLRTPQRINTVRQKLFDELGLSKAQEALPDSTKTTLMKLRTELKKPLDDLSDDYAVLSQRYAEISDSLSDFYKLLGKKFVGASDDILTLRAGELGMRLLGNASADTQRVLDDLVILAKNNGYKVDDDLYRQIYFADVLNNLYKIEKPRGFQGGITQGVEDALQAAGAAKDLASGNILGLASKGVQYLKGQTEAKQIEAIKEFLGIVKNKVLRSKTKSKPKTIDVKAKLKSAIESSKTPINTSRNATIIGINKALQEKTED